MRITPTVPDANVRSGDQQARGAKADRLAVTPEHGVGCIAEIARER
jgi:hypothetical protein